MTKKTNSPKNDAPIMAEELVSGTSKITDSAREFVKRQAATAKERAENLQEGTEKFNSGLETGINRLVGGYVSVLGGIANATFSNVDHALTTVEKLAAAESVSEAIRIQSDYVRDSANANMERVRGAADTVRETVVANSNTMREQMGKVWPYGKKAA